MKPLADDLFDASRSIHVGSLVDFLWLRCRLCHCITRGDDVSIDVGWTTDDIVSLTAKSFTLSSEPSHFVCPRFYISMEPFE